MTVFAVIAFFGMVALVVGIIGLIVSAIRHTKKTRWLIVLLVGLAAAIIFTVAYGVTRDDEASDTTEETVVEEEVVADEESEPAQEVTEEEITEEPTEEVIEEPPAEEPAVTWTVDDTGVLYNENVVSGDAKSVTIEFLPHGSTSAISIMYTFQRVTIGDTIYRLYDGSENGFEGLPIITKLGDTQFDFFLPSISGNGDSAIEVTFTMADGSDLPTSFEMTYDSEETRESVWNGRLTTDNFSNETLTIEHN